VCVHRIVYRLSVSEGVRYMIAPKSAQILEFGEVSQANTLKRGKSATCL
jgi:hypothetical protein